MFKPTQAPGKPGFRVTFMHPMRGKLISAGLGTKSQTEAEALCRKTWQLSQTPEDWQDVPKCVLKYGYKPAAVFFGKDHPALAAVPPPASRIPEGDVGALIARILEAQEMAERLGLSKVQALEDLLAAYEVERFKKLEDERAAALRDLAELQEQLSERDDTIARLRREKNLHVKIRAGQAWTQFKTSDDYKNLSPKTQREIRVSVESFLATLPDGPRFKLGDVRAAHIKAWLDGLTNRRDRDGETPLSPVTKAKEKRYLSVFLTGAYRAHDLAENAMDKVGPVKGAALEREDIAALRIDQLADFEKLLATLKVLDPYWHALVATAMLAGPRYAELAWLKLEHVNLEGSYLSIATRRAGDKIQGTKTGKERRVPIESTTLLPILRDHLARRTAERKDKSASVAQRSTFLFPSTVDENPYKPRERTPAGLWSDNGVFLKAWGKIAEKGAELVAGTYWTFGPREWRHCAGTAMGYSGNDALRISAWLGNSEAVCRRHYVRPSSSGKLWPFKW